ncbi:hypothetical protein BHU72_14630 [Desulfuribacillus stibiiarsenatis]|uniref:Uncharacterized protein n=1 Tax=Desulfuribacillus stibiiarsenatis TaxID=1390249 RepID=A0A1E5L7C4_9FIRM|nr:hypothetical protein [Desulfuribacillus stibiiarsenatis]OEH86062.1 hypothetical protein BHU72_14630 [Desulfuribacillus stibiiarsenatis]
MNERKELSTNHELKSKLKDCTDRLGDAIYRLIIARDLTVIEAMVVRDSVDYTIEQKVMQQAIDNLKFKKI